MEVMGNVFHRGLSSSKNVSPSSLRPAHCQWHWQ
jgi:hypothetical protein